MSVIGITVVVPAFNEESRIGVFLRRIETWVEAHPDTEVVVVDDGSTDGTAAVVESFREQFPELRVVRLPQNRGKGAAVHAGLDASRGRYRVFLDADGSTPIEEVESLVAAAEGRIDVVVMGSIAIEGAVVVQGQLALRQWAGRAGNKLIQLLAVPGVRDTQRGCKLVSAEWCEQVLPLCTVEGWAFDVELLALSRAAGFELVEVPVHWHHVDGSKVTASSYPKTLLDVLRIRARVRRLVRQGSV